MTQVNSGAEENAEEDRATIMQRALMAARWNSTLALRRVYLADLPLLSPIRTAALGQPGYDQDLVPIDRLSESFGKALDWLSLQRKGSLDGSYLEFGVCSGSSMIALHRALDSRPDVSLDFVGFDSFEGLPKNAPHQDDGVWAAAAFMADRGSTEDRLRSHGIESNLVAGWFSDTLNEETRKTLRSQSSPLIMIDCDIYSAAVEALDFCHPFLNGPTVIVFDDWNTADLAERDLGEAKAWNEFLEAHPDVVEICQFESYNENSHIIGVDLRSNGDEPSAASED